MRFENLRCASYVRHEHICVTQKHLNMCMSLFGEGQNLTFKKYDPGQLQTIKYINCDLFGVRKYVLARVYIVF